MEQVRIIMTYCWWLVLLIWVLAFVNWAVTHVQSRKIDEKMRQCTNGKLWKRVQ